MKRRTGEHADSTYQRWETQGRFPKRIQVGPNTNGWYEDEIDEWSVSLPRAADVQTRPSPNPKARRADAVNTAG